MTPRQFETGHAAQWDELDAALARIEGRRKTRDSTPGEARADPARIAMLYRSTCEHLAIAQARAYPAHLTERLEALTQRAHQAIYHRADRTGVKLARFFLVGLPSAVRAHGLYLLVASLVFFVPTLVLGLVTYFDPGFVLTVHEMSDVQDYDEMYGDGARPIGRSRKADDDWMMFGFYVMNNTSVAFRCFAGGIFAGLGSLFFVGYNGAVMGTLAGYLTSRGHATNFYSFIVTHCAFELTAILVSGAAGLAIGHALLAPGRLSRVRALEQAARAAVPLLYGVIVMLLIAAAIEAFWSSARWVPPAVKYGVGGLAWLLVIGYFGWQGRPARERSGAG